MHNIAAGPGLRYESGDILPDHCHGCVPVLRRVRRSRTGTLTAFLATVLGAGSCLQVAAFAEETNRISKQDSKKDPSRIGDRKVGRGLNFYSLEQEMALGKQLSLEVEKQARILDDSIVSEYVNRLGQNLARNSDVDFPVTFKVIESDEINAFTLPGGYVFVNTGLMRLTANEAELASAMSHEIAHAAARHATRQATRSHLLNLGTLPLALLGGIAGLAARQTANIAIPMAFLRYSRDFETEADLLGLEYLWKAGYDPDASIDLFEAMESNERRHPGSVSRLFRTHPLTADRIEKTQKNIETILPSRSEYIVNTSEYENVRTRLGDLLQAHQSETDDSRRPTLKR
jgi:predicted Zn-dependent protease